MLLWKVNQEGLNFVIKQSLHSLVLVQNNKRIENPVKKSKWYQQKLLDCTTPTYVNPNERLGFFEIGIWWSKKTPVLLISDHTCPTKFQRLSMGGRIHCASYFGQSRTWWNFSIHGRESGQCKSWHYGKYGVSDYFTPLFIANRRKNILELFKISYKMLGTEEILIKNWQFWKKIKLCFRTFFANLPRIEILSNKRSKCRLKIQTLWIFLFQVFETEMNRSIFAARSVSVSTFHFL